MEVWTQHVVREVQLLRVSNLVSGQTSGQFALRFNGETTGLLDHDASAVAVRTKAGAATELELEYGAPASDGGAEVTSYTVQYDTSSSFALAPHTVTVPCPTAPVLEV